MINKLLNWEDAEKYCEDNGAHLVTILNEEKYKFLCQYFNLTETWIGCKVEITDLKWINNTKLSYDIPWCNGRPYAAGGVRGTNIQIYHDGSKYGIDNIDGNYYTRNFLCQFNNSLKPIIHGCKFFQGHTYKLITTAMNWYDARNYCNSLGGHLPDIKNIEQNDFVYNISNNMWLGMNDVNNEGNWVYSDETPITFNNFYPGEPNNSSGIEHVSHFTTNAKWNDLNGYGSALQFMIEWDYIENPNYTFVDDNDNSLPNIQNIFTYGNQQIQLINIPKTWYDAKEYCESLGGHLLIIEDINKWNYIINELSTKININETWIGLYYEGYSLNWITGEKYIINNTSEYIPPWYPSRPYFTDSARGKYIQMYSNLMDNIDIAYTRKFIMEYDYIYLPPRTYDNDAIEFNGHHYKLFTEELMYWKDAKDYCELRGGHLVYIKNAEMNNFLMTAFPISGINVWIGLSDHKNEGIWRYTNDELATYFNFDSGQPDNAGGTEHYVHFWGSSGRWNDLADNQQMAFICEWDF